MTSVQSPLLLLAGIFSSAAAIAHLCCIAGGARWYRAMGAGNRMARAAEQGRWQPTVITLFITSVLAVWSLYAFSAVGLVRPMPLTRWALAGIGLVYLIRGLLFVPLKIVFPDNSTAFWYWSSGLCTVIGLCYLIGLWQAWSCLGGSS